MTSERLPGPSAVIQASRTAFYEALQDRELERRQRLSDAIQWFRPVDRLMKQRAIAKIDRLLLSIAITLEDSRAADTAIAENESAVLQAATAIVTTAQDHLAPATDPVLRNNTATEATFTVIEDR